MILAPRDPLSLYKLGHPTYNSIIEAPRVEPGSAGPRAEPGVAAGVARDTIR